MTTRGKPFEAGNKLGRGRPRGSRNKKTTAAAQALFDKYAEPLTRICIKQASEGNGKAMQLCMDRILPPRRDLPVALGKLPTHTAEDVSQASETVITKAATGQITPAQGKVFAELIESRGRIMTAQEFAARLQALEEREQ